MATETADPRASHRRSLVVTAIAAIGGVAAGVATGAIASGASDRIGLAVVAVAFGVELLAIRLFGVDVLEFSTKDNLYVAFMTFALWFITWTILLTTGTSI